MLKLRKNGTRRLPPHSNQAQHLANEGQANNSLLTAIIALVAIIALSLFLFYKAPLAGKAIIPAPGTQIPLNEAGIFLIENTEEEDTPFSVEVWANVPQQTVAISFILDYIGLELAGTACTGITKELSWGSEIISCDNHKINFFSATSNPLEAVGQGPFKIATISFAGADQNTYHLNFDSFNIYDLDDPLVDLISSDEVS